MTLVAGIQIFLFCAAIACIIAAFSMARGRRRQLEARGVVPQAGFWLGQPVAVKRGVGIGWAAFVILNMIAGFTAQPLLACGLFMRAYALRAVCLRRRSRSPR